MAPVAAPTSAPDGGPAEGTAGNLGENDTASGPPSAQSAPGQQPLEQDATNTTPGGDPSGEGGTNDPLVGAIMPDQGVFDAGLVPDAGLLLLDAGGANEAAVIADADVLGDLGAKPSLDAAVVADASVASGPATLDQGTAVVAEAPAPVAPPPPQFVQVPVPTIIQDSGGDPWAGLREIIPGIPTGGSGFLGLLLLLALVGGLGWFIGRARERFAREGIIPSALAVLQLMLRLVVFSLLFLLVLQLLPANVRWVVYFVLISGGVALGWSARDVMPDLIAGIVLVFERRIRKGMWVRGDGFAGSVEQIGFRASWLRDSHGHRVGVPNRHLMKAPVVSDEYGDTVQEVMVRMPVTNTPAATRQALHDAVLASPWSSPSAAPMVMRDPVDPGVWRVRGRLLEASFAMHFEGELLERAEEIVAVMSLPGFAESGTGDTDAFDSLSNERPEPSPAPARDENKT